MSFIIITLIIMTCMGAVASLFLKRASASHGLLQLIKNKNLYIGGLLYFGSSLLNILILQHLDYSVVLPMTSLTYVWTLIISSFALREPITKQKIAGVVLIVLGAIIISAQ